VAIGERDPVTGRNTTGHEWNGIRELDTNVPRIVIVALIATTLFSIVYWILMPAWPIGTTYTRGLLGVDHRDSVERSVERATVDREVWASRIRSLDLEEVRETPELMAVVRKGGRTLFGDNCAVCHGLSGTGGPGYPDLTAGAWQWGGDPNTILETLRVGINSDHPETRFAQMPAFGRDGILETGEIAAIVSFLRSNAEVTVEPSERDKQSVEEGQELFAQNCAACHGMDARGTPEMGAPDLLDANWVHGGDRATLFSSIADGRQAHMPHWEGRLDEVQRRILALYVVELSARDADGKSSGHE
jgi:cytochrome c oxidase cbb3-type subunit III